MLAEAVESGGEGSETIVFGAVAGASVSFSTPSAGRGACADEREEALAVSITRATTSEAIAIPGRLAAALMNRNVSRRRCRLRKKQPHPSCVDCQRKR
jgi:hypothetical protein